MFGNMGILSSIKGPKGLIRGWAPTFVGYSFQGLGKFGCNDFFKYKYEQLLGHEWKVNNPKLYYALCSGSAEFFADILLIIALLITIQTGFQYTISTFKK